MPDSTVKPTATELLWVITGKVFAFTSSILLVKLLTHTLGLSEYAELTLALTVCNFFAQIIMGAIGQGIGRVYIDVIAAHDFLGFKQSMFDIKKDLIKVYFLIFIGLMLIAAIANEGAWIALAAALLLYSFVNGINDIASGLQNLARNRRESSIGIMIDGALKIILVYIFSRAFSLSAFSVIVCYVLASCSSLIYQNLIFYKLSNKKETIQVKDPYKWKGQILKISGHASFWGVFVWLQQASDKWALNFFQGAESVSQYAVLYQVGYAPFVMGMGVVMSLFTPIIYKAKRRNLMNKLLGSVGIITIMAFFISKYYSYEILSAVVDRKYLVGSDFLPYMLLAAGLFQAGEVVSSQMMGENRPRDMLKIKIFSSCLCVMTNIIGACFFGLVGVVGSMVLFGSVYFICFMYYSILKKGAGVIYAA